jgi:hypothetical protein
VGQGVTAWRGRCACRLGGGGADAAVGREGCRVAACKRNYACTQGWFGGALWSAQGQSVSVVSACTGRFNQ